MSDREEQLEEELGNAIRMRDYWVTRFSDLEAANHDLEQEAAQLRKQAAWLNLVLLQRGRTVRVEADPALYSVAVQPEAS